MAIQLGLPLVHAAHVALEEDADALNAGQDRAGLGFSVPDQHHHHDESQCAVCQTYLRARQHGFTYTPNLDLTVERLRFLITLPPSSRCCHAAPHDADARGPPGLA